MEKSGSFNGILGLDRKNGIVKNVEETGIETDSGSTTVSNNEPEKVPEIIPVQIEPGKIATCHIGWHFVWINSIKRTGVCARDSNYQCSDYNDNLG